jgi:hypothetical protein
MTSDRANAYRRVIATLRDIGPATLSRSEQACIREAADILLVCDDLDREDARAALPGAATLADRLIEAGRWTSWRARRLLDDILGCGPGAGAVAAAAA